MVKNKSERLSEIMLRLGKLAPFSDGTTVRMALEEVIGSVEDEYSGVPENPEADTSPPDGRMYPPHDRFEIASGSHFVRVFKQTRHRTSIGMNGSLCITRSDGVVEINLCGKDGRTVADLLKEQENEPR